MSTEIMTIQNVRGYVDAQGTAWLNAEDVARGLGFVNEDEHGNITILWKPIRNYLSSFGYKPVVGSCDEINTGSYIPENMFYRLAMKIPNLTTEKFHALVADEILPELRKMKTYSIGTPASVADMIKDVQKTAVKIQALFPDVKHSIALAQAIDIVSSFRNFNLGNLKMLFAPTEQEKNYLGEKCYLDATDIGEKLGLGEGARAACKANILLEQEGLLERKHNEWHVTEFGNHYGLEIPYTNRDGHTCLDILWRPDIITLLELMRKKKA